MGILTETFQSDTSNHKTSNTKQLPGNFSFAVRELPKEEIEMVVDSGSIYALDFLQLQYTPAAPLDAILTTTAMQAYDDIFRFLLKLLRTLHVATKLRQLVAIARRQSSSSTSTGERFSIQAHHCITVLMSHFMDVGIEATWRTFSSSLNKVENALGLDDAASAATGNLRGPNGLRSLHETCLERMRTKLFLRRRQQKLRKGVESILTALLRCACSLSGDKNTDFVAESSAFVDSVTGLVTLLRSAVDRSAKDSPSSQASEEDIEAMRMLLSRLTWNGLYEDTTS